jgi:hypothetical protein
MTDTNIPQQTPPDPVTSVTVTSLNRKWTIKMVLICLVVFLFGVWAIYDALVAYPKRGYNAAEFIEYQYLEQFERDRGVISNSAGIADPQSKLQELNQRQSTVGQLDVVDDLLKRWLENLSLVSKLVPEATAIPRTDFRGTPVESANQRLETLTAKWTRAGGTKLDAPKPLSAFDIPSQWIILVICWAIAAWMAVVLLRSKQKVYRWDPTTQRLTLADGKSFTPSDIAEFDKRKWHKFFVTILIKPSHTTLGGKSVELDLLRYDPLEAWVLAMERTAFPESVKQEEEPAAPDSTSPSGDEEPNRENA